MTATEWLFKKLWETPKDKFTWHSILNKAQEKENHQFETLKRVNQLNEDLLIKKFKISLENEISDEEIEKEIKKRYETTQNDAGFRDGCAWYREQLKNKK